MRRVAAVLSGAALAACGPAPGEAGQASGQAAAAVSSGDPEVDALLAAISARDSARAHALIGEVGYLTVDRGLIATEDELLDRLLGCRVEELKVTRSIIKYRVVWSCPAGSDGRPVYYNGAIGTPPFTRPGRGLAVVEFMAGRTNPAFAPGFVPPPPPGINGQPLVERGTPR